MGKKNEAAGQRQPTSAFQETTYKEEEILTGEKSGLERGHRFLIKEPAPPIGQAAVELVGSQSSDSGERNKQVVFTRVCVQIREGR